MLRATALGRVSVLALLVCSSLDCVAEPSGASASTKLDRELVPGLRLLAAEPAEDDGHLVETLVHEGYVYTANSLGIVTMRLDEGGGLTMTDNGKQAAGQWTSCTTIAIHRSSDTLYCGSDGPSQGNPRVEIYDLADPAAPTLREPLPLESWAVRNLHVVDDTLLIHQFDAGLWTAQIDARRDLSALTRTAVEGNIRFSVRVGESLVSAFADVEGSGTELRVLEPSSLVELDRLALDGPPLGLSADEEGRPTVVVALGSGGLAIVDLDGDRL